MATSKNFIERAFLRTLQAVNGEENEKEEEENEMEDMVEDEEEQEEITEEKPKRKKKKVVEEEEFEEEVEKPKKTKKKRKIIETEKEIEPEDPALEFDKFPGMVAVPIEEATDFFANLEGVSGKELKKRLTELYYKNRYYRAWLNKIYDAYKRAKLSGAQSVLLPPVPDEVKDIFKESKKDDDMSDKEYIREIMKLMGPYIAIGKALRGEDLEEKPTPQKSYETPMIEIEKPDGSIIRVPSWMGGSFGVFPNAAQPKQEDTELKEKLARIEERLANPFASIPQITVKGADGSEFSLPITFAKDLGLLPTNENKSDSGESEVMKVVERLANTVEKLQERLMNLPQPDELGKRALEKMKEERDFWMEILQPKPPEVRRESEIEKEKIRQMEETKREQERTKQKQWEVLKTILTEDEKKEEEKDLKQLGKSFLNKVTEEARKMNLQI
ncbi:MAG: hypothetical protein DRG69_07185 [Deltaproteobacteria bacterium]|nr:MAG: hypothetical protein DRG69_07185 [Deltaproteobacteria bacterium]